MSNSDYRLEMCIRDSVCGYVMAEDVPAIGRDDILGTTSQAKTDNPKREGLSTIPQTDDSFRLELVIGLLDVYKRQVTV